MKIATLPKPDEEPGVSPVPCDLELERTLLAMVIADNALLDDLAPLQPEDLYDYIHGSVLASAMQLREEKRPVNLVTLRARFGQVPFPTGGSVIEYLGALSPNGQIPALSDVVSSLRELRMRRDMMALGERISSMAWDQVAGPSVLLASAKIDLDMLHAACSPIKNPILTAAEAIDELMERVRNGDQSQRVPSGFLDFDQLTGGFGKKQYHILAGRPGSGKSTCGVVFGSRAARAGHGVLVFSLEMTRDQWMARVLADAAWQNDGAVPYSEALRGRLNEQQIRKLEAAAVDRRNYPLFIDDSSGLSVLEIAMRTRELKKKLEADGMSLDMVIVDQLSKVKPLKNHRGSRSHEMEEISGSMQQFAKDEDVALIALHQLNRGVEGRDNKRPVISDLRESGCLAGSTLVLDAETGARRRIDEIVSSGQPLNVIALKEKTLKSERSPISRAFCTGVKPVLDLSLATGRKITATANHKFLTQRGWLRLDEIATSDYIATPRKIAAPATPQDHLRDDEVVLLAHMIGDGCALPRHAVQYTCGEIESAEIVTQAARQIFGDKVAPRISPERNWFQVYLSSSQRLTHGKKNPVGQWLDMHGLWGKRAHEKFVPEAVFSLGNEKISLFIAHLWSTDGHAGIQKSGRPAAYYSTSSEALARDVQSLLLRVGIVARLRSTQKTGYRATWSVNVSDCDSMRLLAEVLALCPLERHKRFFAGVEAYMLRAASNPNEDIIPYGLWQPLLSAAAERRASVPRKQRVGIFRAPKGGIGCSRKRIGELAATLDCGDLALLARSDVYWDAVRSVEPAGEAEVYDLSVPGNHNFTANDIFVHNSFEQDADMVLLVYRQAYYLERQREDNNDQEQARQEALANCRNMLEIGIAKQRNGPTDTVDLYVDMAANAIRDKWRGG